MQIDGQVGGNALSQYLPHDSSQLGDATMEYNGDTESEQSDNAG
jgi:hypothetical protein